MLGKQQCYLISLVTALNIRNIAAAISCTGSSGIPAASPGGNPCNSNTNTFTCDNKGSDKCDGAKIIDVEGSTSICKATSPADNSVCISAQIRFRSTLTVEHSMICEGPNACIATQVTANAKGKLVCKPGETNTATSTATAACGGTVGPDGFVAFQPVNAGCLECTSQFSCGNYILFKDAGKQNSVFEQIPDNFIGLIGSNCQSQKPAKSCFSGSNLVEVYGKGTISMKSLAVGDFVKTSGSGNKIDYSRVMAFLHINDHEKVDYLQFYTDNMGADVPLEISADHFVFLANHKLLRAVDVTIGDVFVGNKKVTAIKNVKRNGLYAPVTQNGNILVSGVQASCYVSVLNDLIPTMIQVKASHSALAPLRLICTSPSLFCKNQSTLHEGGATHDLTYLLNLGYHIAGISTVLQVFVLVMAFPFLTFLVLVELAVYHVFLAAMFFGIIFVRKSITCKKIFQ